MTSMLISGAFAGLAGAMEGLGTFEYATVKGAFTGVGFDGIAVALLGEHSCRSCAGGMPAWRPENRRFKYAD